ncbi:MAG: hypothetical protein K0R65_2383 [Crocinitomicaceae bacterium]|jgi:hypothetical protein|nr:hypothetical protein [Crocinitomicaceae bacterium]
MNAKLTLTIEEMVIERAKKYAKERERSLSDLIENYLKALTQDSSPVIELTPIVKSLKGAFQAPKDFDYKTELTKALSKKHL